MENPTVALQAVGKPKGLDDLVELGRLAVAGAEQVEDLAHGHVQTRGVTTTTTSVFGCSSN
jgi:hypothetical protein